MDDGASSFAETAGMLRAAHRDGIAHIFATPHIQPGRKPFDFERYARNLQMARNFCRKQDLPLRLHSGSEILYTEESIRLLRAGRVPTLGGTAFVLVEFVPSASINTLLNAGRKFNNAGYIPVYAHVERYACLRKRENVHRLHMLPEIRLQINAATILKRRGILDGLFLKWLFRERLVDYVATDAHGMRARATCMHACFQALEKQCGREYAEKLAFRNQREILNEVRRNPAGT